MDEVVSDVTSLKTALLPAFWDAAIPVPNNNNNNNNNDMWIVPRDKQGNDRQFIHSYFQFNSIAH